MQTTEGNVSAVLPATYAKNQPSKAGFRRLVDYRAQLSNFYASYARLARFAKYLEKRGIMLLVRNGQDND